MKDQDVEKLIELTYIGGGFIPANEKAEQLTLNCAKGEVVSFIEVTNRDLSFHKCYMSLLGYIYDQLPISFRNSVNKNNFYKWVKHLKGQYKVDFKFKDGTKLVTYDSISFGRMKQNDFKEYVKEQLPFIYEEIVSKLYASNPEFASAIIDNIELEYEKFLSKL